MGEKKIQTTIEDPASRLPLPNDQRIQIVQLAIGTEVHYFSYNASVTTINGNVSGGGTQTGSYTTYDFGFGITNSSNVSMRVQFTFAKLDADGYSVDKQYAWVDVEPGEKRRKWAELNVKTRQEFKSYKIINIGVGPTPSAGARNWATWSAETAPQTSIFDVFELGPLLKSQARNALWLPAMFFLLIGLIGLSSPVLIYLTMPRMNLGSLDSGSKLAIAGIIGVSLLLIYGAAQMVNFKRYPIAMTVSLLALIPIFPLCFVSMPLGIWALVVLRRDDVKALFT